MLTDFIIRTTHNPYYTCIHANKPDIYLHTNEVPLNIYECVEATLRPRFDTIQLQSEIAAAHCRLTL